ncbi:putative peptidyl-tRNA hydrolase PTRHD1 [Bradysia coprophila]|uniref:putative peptidyl-tRNA hydrolase PTRHD1 n=1 Tax=Bradysia coprophila TaxID=38358 RepID=UPI00187DB373|nr:putative peptidyl-tRNA hydrolase PTRHD1 [Bradysia coprophila]
MDRIVQYIIVRGDLSKSLQWPIGAVIAQCCHATTAICNETANDTETKEYFNDMDNMHKVVLEATDDTSLNSLSEKLKENGIVHKLWIEKPEMIPTCIAIKPYQKKQVHSYVKHLKLMK